MTRLSLYVLLGSSCREQRADALAFSLKMSKHSVAQHLLDKYSRYFDLVKGRLKEGVSPCSSSTGCGWHMNMTSAGYVDILDESYMLEIMFSINKELSLAKYNKTRELLAF